MANTSLVDLSELSKPATVLVEKVSEAIGGIAKPWQIRRVARAEADAEIIKAGSQIKINELQRRTLNRFVTEEVNKQLNIEEITAKALPHVHDEAQPQNMDDDWITNFFDKCRLISDEEMQFLWSRVLAGEANFPGSYSKRTVNFLETIDKSDASLFQRLCGYGWSFGYVAPLIYDVNAEIYTKSGINFRRLKHLDEIGLLSFESISGYRHKGLPKSLRVSYYGKPVEIEFANEKDNVLDIGHVTLSKVGLELAPICDSKPNDDFFHYVINHWTKIGLTVTFT